jgi:hypothetical protein
LSSEEVSDIRNEASAPSLLFSTATTDGENPVLFLNMAELFFLFCQPRPLNILGRDRSTLSTDEYFHRASHAHSLSTETHQALFIRNLMGVVSFHGLFLVRESEAFNDLYFCISVDALYGTDLLEKTRATMKELDANGTLIKIMMHIISFSSHYSLVVYDTRKNISSELIPANVSRLQDILVITLWKYLTYRYSF